jgi:hypothetical protein
VRRSSDRAGAARPTGGGEDGRLSRRTTSVESRTVVVAGVVALRCGRAAGTVVAAGRAPRSRGACVEGATTGCRIVSALALGVAGRAGGRDAAGGEVERAGATAAGAATGSAGARSSAGGADGASNSLAAAGEG